MPQNKKNKTKARRPKSKKNKNKNLHGPLTAGAKVGG